jgi:hypothetical protein
MQHGIVQSKNPESFALIIQFLKDDTKASDSVDVRAIIGAVECW